MGHAKAAKEKSAKGYVRLSSGEREQNRIDTLRQSRIQRLLQVREQERALSKLRKEDFNYKIRRYENHLLHEAKESWLNDKDNTLHFLDKLYEQLKENVGEGHEKAGVTTTKGRRAEARANKRRLKAAETAQMRFASALEVVNEEQKKLQAQSTEFKQRQDAVKAHELEIAHRRIDKYYAWKEKREAELQEREAELLDLLAPNGGHNYVTSHIHELGMPVQVERHARGETDANAHAASYNDQRRRMLSDRKVHAEEQQRRAAERLHAAAQVLKVKELSQTVESQLEKLWVTERQGKIESMLDTRRDNQRGRDEARRKSQKVESQVEAILNIKPAEKKVEVFESIADEEDFPELKWTSTLPRAHERTDIPKVPAAAKKKRSTNVGKEDAKSKRRDARRELRSVPTPNKKAKVDISIPGRTKKKPDKTAQKKRPSERTKVGGKNKAAVQERPGTSSRLQPKDLLSLDKYSDLRDPDSLQQLADNISLLTSSVFTDASLLAMENQADRSTTLSDSSGMVGTARMDGSSSRGYNKSLPSTSSLQPRSSTTGGAEDSSEERALNEVLRKDFFDLSNIGGSDESPQTGSAASSLLNFISSPSQSSSERSERDLVESVDEALYSRTGTGTTEKEDRYIFSPSSSSSGELSQRDLNVGGTLYSSVSPDTSDRSIDDFLDNLNT